MIGENRKRPTNLLFILFLASAVLFAFQINPVLADVPTVESVVPWTNGTDTILNITVRHNFLWGGGHHIDELEVDINGTVHMVEINGWLTPDPKYTGTFVVQYNMSKMVGIPVAKVRAHCTLHGWSVWSEPVIVPEFSTISLILILAIVSIAVLLPKSRA